MCNWDAKAIIRRDRPLKEKPFAADGSFLALLTVPSKYWITPDMIETDCLVPAGGRLGGVTDCTLEMLYISVYSGA